MGSAKLTILCGHYGCGKTNLALDLALEAAGQGRQVVVADLDLVNPYFRSSDYRELLEANGIKVVAPVYAGTTLDLPAIAPQLTALPDADCDEVIFDVGGDDAGACVLGCLAGGIRQRAYTMLYVVNAYRALTQTPQEAAAICREIETACRLRATAVVNNSHLQQETTSGTVLRAAPFGIETARLLSLPLLYHTAPEEIAGELEGKLTPVRPVKVRVRPPWSGN